MCIYIATANVRGLEMGVSGSGDTAEDMAIYAVILGVSLTVEQIISTIDKAPPLKEKLCAITAFADGLAALREAAKEFTFAAEVARSNLEEGDSAASQSPSPR